MNKSKTYACGRNDYGQLGYPSNLENCVQVTNIDDIIESAGGFSHSLILKEDGTVWAWGSNSYGQLGDGTNTDSNEPVQVIKLTNIIGIATGDYHSLALKSDGTLWAWGANSDGQLGDGTNTNTNEPVKVSNLSGLENVKIISSGSYHSLAIRTDGTVWTWGGNWNGQLGDGTNTNSNKPVQVSATTDLSSVTCISGGAIHSLAIDSNGTAWAWGANWNGQLGNGSTENSNIPVEISTSTGLSNVKKISGGGYHSLAINNDGTVWTWGDNSYGQLGDGTNTSSNEPVQIHGLTNVESIAAGYNHNLAMKSDDTIWGTNLDGSFDDGAVWAWGANSYGQLGDNTTTNSNIPVRVSNLTNVSFIAAGEYHSLTVRNDKTIWVWGNNLNGQLGLGYFGSFSNIPLLISNINNITDISAGNAFNLALKKDGKIRAWGINHDGQLGIGTTGGSTDTPVLIDSLTGVIAIAAGYTHSLALKNDGTVWAWGVNQYGQLGDGTYNDSNQPVSVLGLTDIIDISASYHYSLALKTDGTVWAWGGNWNGQLGNGTNNSSSNTPVQVITTTGLTDIIKISAGNYHSLALKDDGTVLAWGVNWNGQLGDGSNNSSNKPVQVNTRTGLTNINEISAGAYHSLALKNDGTAWAWGNNGSGQLGDRTNNNSYLPVQVSKSTGLTNVQEISGGESHSLARNKDGTVWAWGNNGYGQLGDGTLINSNQPIQISDLNDSIAISCGINHSLILKSGKEEIPHGIAFWIKVIIKILIRIFHKLRRGY